MHKHLVVTVMLKDRLRDLVCKYVSTISMCLCIILSLVIRQFDHNPVSPFKIVSSDSLQSGAHACIIMYMQHMYMEKSPQHFTIRHYPGTLCLIVPQH